MDAKSREQARKLVHRYIADVQGQADAGRFLTQNVMDKFWKNMGWDTDGGDTARKLVNFVSSTGEAAAQGARVVAAIRDFTSGVLISNMRYGPTRTLEVIKMGIFGLENLTPSDAERMGLIPRGGIVHFADATEHGGNLLKTMRSKAGRTLDDVNQVLFRLSFQKDVYKMFHAGHYLSTMKNASEQLLRYGKKEISFEDMGRNLYLHKMDQPVALEFKRLVDQGKNEDAIHFLARQTGQEMVGVYGMGNNAHGWNSNVGRLAGQFGQWSVWFRSTFFREINRGTLADRAGSLAMLIGTQKIMTATGAAFGLNLNRWQPTSGTIFTGGPLMDAAQTVADAVQGYGYQQEEARERLKRYLPWEESNGLYNIGQIYAPGSFFAYDLYKAFSLASEGDPRAIPQAAGIPIEND
jgi:hypothetical protein